MFSEIPACCLQEIPDEYNQTRLTSLSIILLSLRVHRKRRAVSAVSSARQNRIADFDIVLPMDAPVAFRLDRLEIHPDTGLVSGPGGREKLNPKVMDVLVLMTRHPRQVVTRDELMERLWPGMVVTDDAVTRCFYLLRRQLSRAGGDSHYRTADRDAAEAWLSLQWRSRQLDSSSARSPRLSRQVTAPGRSRS